MSVTEKIADLIEQVQTDWQMRHPDNALPLAETTAKALVAAFPQLALEGREEWGVLPEGDAVAVLASEQDARDEHDLRRMDRDDDGNGYDDRLVTRTVYETKWSEVQS